MQEYTCIGHAETRTLLNSFKNNSEIFLYFYGTKDADGKSWCSDCNDVYSAVQNAKNALADGSIFINVDVGDRNTWKDQNCIFRTDKDFSLLVIPTLIKWKTPKRLEGFQCGKTDLLEMFFSDDE